MIGRRDFTGLWCAAVFALALGWGYLRPVTTQSTTTHEAFAASATSWSDGGSTPTPEMRRLCQRMVTH